MHYFLHNFVYDFIIYKYNRGFFKFIIRCRKRSYTSFWALFWYVKGNRSSHLFTGAAVYLNGFSYTATPHLVSVHITFDN